MATESEKVEVVDAIVDHVQDSYDLAMAAEDIDEDTRERVHNIVGDAVGNNADSLLDELDELDE